MGIFALSRKQVESMSFFDNDYVISITDPPTRAAKINAKHVLRLKFWDVTDERTSPYWFPDIKGTVAMTDIDADRVIEFIKDLRQTDNIFVHCERGLSRSTGIAAAIADYLASKGSWYFENKYPNSHCYFLVRRKLEDSRIEKWQPEKVVVGDYSHVRD